MGSCLLRRAGLPLLGLGLGGVRRHGGRGWRGGCLGMGKPHAQGAALGDEKIAPPDQSATIIAELRAENAGLKTRINDLSDHIQTLKAELAAAKEREIRLLPQPHKGFFSRIFG